jgi:hypothetical protein
MTLLRHGTRIRFAGAILVVAGGLHGRAARGQDDWDGVVKKTAEPPEQHVVMELPAFNEWVLDGKTRELMEEMLRSQLARELEAIHRACELSAAQREKLRLAGEGDLKRLFRRIDRAQTEYREAGEDPQKIKECARELWWLQAKIQGGILGEASLFQKVLRQTLSRKQWAQYEVFN